MDVGELGVGVFEVRQRDLSGRPGRAAAGFGDAELDAFRRTVFFFALMTVVFVPMRRFGTRAFWRHTATRTCTDR